MLCDDCQKEPATVHVTRIINGEKSEVRLCAACAAKRESDAQPFEKLSISDPGFTFHHILAGLFDTAASPMQKSRVAPTMRCSGCGLTLEDFRRIGHLGCSRCYEEFSGVLDPLIKRIHRSSEHTGKYPRDVSEKLMLKREIEQLKTALNQAVADERYEEAARLRDEIKTLQDRAEGVGNSDVP